MMIFLLEDDHDLPLATLTRPSYSTYFRTTSLFTPLMCQIVGIHVKHAKMFQVIRHAKMCKSVSMRVREFQDNKREKKVKLQGNEHIRGLISHQFTFSKRGMLGTLTLGGNRFQVQSLSAFYVPSIPLLLLIYFPKTYHYK